MCPWCVVGDADCSPAGEGRECNARRVWGGCWPRGTGPVPAGGHPPGRHRAGRGGAGAEGAEGNPQDFQQTPPPPNTGNGNDTNTTDYVDFEEVK